MAWRNILVNNSSGITQSLVDNPDYFMTNNYPISDISNINTYPSTAVISGWIIGDTNNGVHSKIEYGQYLIDSMKLHNTSSWYYSATANIQNDNQFSFVALVNDETQTGFIRFIYLNTTYNIKEWFAGTVSGNDAWKSAMYTILTDNEVVTFHWKSVSNIKGYFGELELPIIKDDAINSGQPVTNATISAFNRLPEQSKIINLRYKHFDIIESDPFTIGKKNFEFTMGSNNICDFTFRDSTPEEIADRIYVNASSAQDAINAYFSLLIDEDQEAATISCIYKNAGDTYSYNLEELTTAEMKQLYLWLVGNYDEDQEENEDTGPSQDWSPRQPDVIAAPTKPAISAVNTGFTTMYMIKGTDEAELRKLSSYMWSDDWIDVVKKWFNDPSEVIVGLAMFPCKPDTENADSFIKAGGITTDAKGYKLTDQYKDITIGTLHIDNAGYNFLDYTPYTKLTIVLPYAGEHSLDVNNVMGKDLELHYMVDFLNGACIAYILVNGSCDYLFGGQMGSQIPISKSSYNNMLSAIVSAGATIGETLGSIASGGLTAPIGSGIAGAMIQNGMNMHPNVSYTSGGGGASGWISGQQPFVRYEEPIPKKANSQNLFFGLPSYINRKLKTCNNFTKVIDAHLEDIYFCPDSEAITPEYYPATENEKTKILEQLKNGVIIKTGSNLPNLTPTTNTDTVIWFTKTTSENNVIGKTFDTTGEKVEGKLLNNQSVIQPKYVIKSVDIRKYNYVFIPEMHRFYFIDDIELTNGDIYVVSMHCDVLQTYKETILDSFAILERQAYKTNKYMNDSMIWTQQNKNIVPNDFHTNGFDRSDNCYILTVAGG